MRASVCTATWYNGSVGFLGFSPNLVFQHPCPGFLSSGRLAFLDDDTSRSSCESQGADGLCALASRDGRWFGGSCLSGSTNGQWVAPVLDLANVPGLGNLLGSPGLWVAFVFMSDGANTRPEGAHLDNVQVRGCAAASCPRQGSSPVTMQEATGLSTWNIVRQIPSSTE